MGPRETVGELVGLVCRPRGHRGSHFHYATGARAPLGVPGAPRKPRLVAVL